MSKITKDQVEQQEYDEYNDEYDDDIGPDDYVFVIKPDGGIKTVIFPSDEVTEYSEQLLAVFKALGVDDPDDLLSGPPTLH
jgi:alkyl hydroperoxide reductase subunit AhpC